MNCASVNPEYLYPRKMFEQRDDPDTKHKGASSKVKQSSKDSSNTNSNKSSTVIPENLIFSCYQHSDTRESYLLLWPAQWYQRILSSPVTSTVIPENLTFSCDQHSDTRESYLLLWPAQWYQRIVSSPVPLIWNYQL